VPTYIGQSGFPLLDFDDKGRVVGSIATHVTGGGSKNFAPHSHPMQIILIRPPRIISLAKVAVPKPFETCHGINYHNVPVPPSEADVHTATAALYTSKIINRGIPDGVLTDGQLFWGLVGSASSILAGTTLGYAGKLALSVISHDGHRPGVLPSHTGYSERALIAECALQYLLVNSTLPNGQKVS
jgi:hypothetical protein